MNFDRLTFISMEMWSEGSSQLATPTKGYLDLQHAVKLQSLEVIKGLSLTHFFSTTHIH